MATTTAKIEIISTDLLSDSMDLQTTMTLYDAGGSTGTTKFTGIARYSTGSTLETLLVDASNYSISKANKLYIKNTSTDVTENVVITVGTAGSSSILGRIYGGQWALIPWSGDTDLNVIQSATGITIEWALFYE